MMSKNTDIISVILNHTPLPFIDHSTRYVSKIFNTESNRIILDNKYDDLQLMYELCKIFDDGDNNYIFTKFGFTEEYLHNTLCQVSAMSGNLACLKYSIEKNYIYSNLSCIAIIYGHVDILEYVYGMHNIINNVLASHLLNNSVKLHNISRSKFPYVSCGNTVDCLKFMHAKGPIDIPEIFEICSVNGILEGLKYLVEINCIIPNNTFLTLAHYGHLDCLKYSYENGFVIKGDVCNRALLMDHIDCFKYLIEHCHCEISIFVYRHLLSLPNLELLRYIFDNGFQVVQAEHNLVIYSEDMEIIKYMHSLGLEFNDSAINISARIGRLDMIIYFRQYGCQITSTACNYAAINGHLECLKYFINNGCIVNYDLYYSAAYSHSIDCLKYLIELNIMDINLISDIIYESTICNGNIKCLIYAHEIGIPWNEETLHNTIYFTFLEGLKYLYENGCPWDDVLIKLIMEYDVLEYLIYLHSKNHPIHEGYKYAIEYDSLKCLSYLSTNGFEPTEEDYQYIKESKLSIEYVKSDIDD